jgi:hypothetical protein
MPSFSYEIFWIAIDISICLSQCSIYSTKLRGFMTVNTLNSSVFNRSTKVLGLVAGTMMAVTLMPIDRAQAVPTFDGNRNNLNGITGLQVGSTIYDVIFGPQNYTGFFGNDALPQFDAAGALQAANSINAFFNLPDNEFGDAGLPNDNDNLIGQNNFSYLVPYLRNGNDITSIQSVISPGVVPAPGVVLDPEWNISNDVTIGRNDQQTYARFDNARAVPVPTPALLPGLVGMGLSFWRKRKEEASV